jgi:hypothetical protein
MRVCRHDILSVMGMVVLLVGAGAHEERGVREAYVFGSGWEVMTVLPETTVMEEEQGNERGSEEGRRQWPFTS